MYIAQSSLSSDFKEVQQWREKHKNHSLWLIAGKSSIWKVKEPRELKLIESAEDGEGASSYFGMKRTIKESWSQKQWVTAALNQEKTKPVSSSLASVFFSKDNDLQAFHMRLN